MYSDFFLRDIWLKPIADPSQSYVCTLPVVQALGKIQRLSMEAPVTFLVGENGAGKSTLLEAIAVAFRLNEEGGSRNFQLFHPTQNDEPRPVVSLSGGYPGRQTSSGQLFLRRRAFSMLPPSWKGSIGGTTPPICPMGQIAAQPVSWRKLSLSCLQPFSW